MASYPGYLFDAAAWNPNLPLAHNICRIVQGVPPQDDERSVRAETSFLEDINAQMALFLLAGTVAGASTVQATATLEDLRDAVKKLNSIYTNLSTLGILGRQIDIFFAHGSSAASALFTKLHNAAESGTTDILIDLEDAEYCPVLPWRSCKLAATLVLVLSSQTQNMFKALKFNSLRLGGLPTLSLIRTTPSASFDRAFREAKAAAQSAGAKTTVIGVSLIDVHIFELQQEGAAEPWSSFAHTFVVGIGPEGVRIWQAWGEHGYKLQEYIERGGARVRSWEEAEQFMVDFNRLVARQGTWNSKRNKWYRRCFDVDINEICGHGKLQRPIVPKYKTWVRLHTMKNVRREDVLKFHWESP